MDYKKAKAACVREGTRLLELNTKEDAREIEGYIRKKGHGSMYVWLGIQRHRRIGSTPVWKWDSGKELAYQKWLSRRMSDLEKCAEVQLGKGLGSWRGTMCKFLRRAICMKKGKCKKMSDHFRGLQRFGLFAVESKTKSKNDKCPMEYENAYSKSPYCYKLHPKKTTVSYKQAKATCKKEGGQVLELSSKKEANAVERHFRLERSRSYSVWLSLQKYGPEKSYRPMSGKQLKFQNWQPSNKFSPQKDCVTAQMWGYQTLPSKMVTKWTTTECKARHYFICMQKGQAWKGLVIV